MKTVYVLIEYWPWENVGNFKELEGNRILSIHSTYDLASKALNKHCANPDNWESDNCIKICDYVLNE